MAGTGSEAKERKILVAVDEGEESSYALSWCLKNILSFWYLFSTDIIASMEKYGNEVAESVMEKAKKLCKENHDVKVETRVECGDPRDVICKTAEKLGVDVVVMGSHGYGLIKRAFLGSVSNHCAQNVKCPVLIVKRPKSAAPST
ncbi:hypothetical protein C3L33_22266, partial [Rhododendron williamsianum]